MDHPAGRDALTPSRKEIIHALAMVVRKLHSHEIAEGRIEPSHELDSARRILELTQED